MTKLKQMKLSSKNIALLKKICEEYSVKTLAVFGSALRDDFNEKSDIDFVVDFKENDPFKYTDLYFALKIRLEQLFDRPIDLIEERGIKNKFFRSELENTKQLIYNID